MLIINVLVLMAVSFLCGYAIGKGKIEIVRPVKMTVEQQERLDKQIKDQEEAIRTYNEMCNRLSNYVD